MRTAIVLLSGGMDSACALYHACNEYDQVFPVSFDYDQKGQPWEYLASHCLIMAAKAKFEPNTLIGPHIMHRVKIWADSALTIEDASLEPNRIRQTGKGVDVPWTFVPGRNLIFIAHATSIAFEVEASAIIGGWNGIDVDYPDCKSEFLWYAAAASSLAIGRYVPYFGSQPIDGGIPDPDMGGCYDRQYLRIYSPVQNMDKRQIVEYGQALFVPWKLTRSCYASERKPCLECDSCIKRVRAFALAGVRDPLVEDDDVWASIVEEAQTHEQQVDCANGDHSGCGLCCGSDDCGHCGR